jgi:hypothetical protein
MMIKKIFILAVLVEFLFAGVYIVPQEYDNMIASSKSSSYGIITQATVDLSGNSYTIGGKSVRFKCLKIPKISCVAAAPNINANISETSLKRPTTEELLLTFQTDIRIEEDATNWYVCGAAYGGQIWDDSSLSSATTAAGTEITYTYVPNSKSEEYHYFTNQANASTQSYLTVSYDQICQ